MTVGPRVEHSLEGEQPARKGRSAYNNTKQYLVRLRDQWTLRQSADLLAMAPGGKFASLSKVTGDDGGRRVASHSTTDEGKTFFKLTPKTVDMNDRVGSVALTKLAENETGTRGNLYNVDRGRRPLAGRLRAIPAITAPAPVLTRRCRRHRRQEGRRPGHAAGAGRRPAERR